MSKTKELALEIIKKVLEKFESYGQTSNLVCEFTRLKEIINENKFEDGIIQEIDFQKANLKANGKTLIVEHSQFGDSITISNPPYGRESSAIFKEDEKQVLIYTNVSNINFTDDHSGKLQAIKKEYNFDSNNNFISSNETTINNYVFVSEGMVLEHLTGKSYCEKIITNAINENTYVRKTELFYPALWNELEVQYEIGKGTYNLNYNNVFFHKLDINLYDQYLQETITVDELYSQNKMLLKKKIYQRSDKDN